MRIKAAVSHGKGEDFEILAVDIDEPRADEILVRIAAVGICHTDIVAHEGAFGFDLPAVLGHEGSGVVEAVGAAVTKVAPGDRVIISFGSCGVCAKCADQHPAYCYDMPALNYAGARTDGSKSLHRDGSALVSNFFGQSSFGSHALTYERNVVKLPDDIPFEVAAPLGCGIQTGAGSILLVLKPPSGSSLLVTGGGAVGLSAVMAARLLGCAPIIVVEPHAARRALALDLGATHAIDPAEASDLAGAIRAIVPIGVDFAFDTTGREEVLAAIMNVLGPQGTVGLVGIGAPETRMPGNLNQAMTYGHSLRGIIEGDSDPDIFLPRLIDYYRDGALPVDRLIRTYPFDRINEAVADHKAGKCVKAVLVLS